MIRIVSGAAVVVWFFAIAVGPSAAQSVDRPQGSQQSTAPQKPATAKPVDHSQHQERPRDLPPFIPVPTDEDRKAAFPDVDGHTVHDHSINYYMLFDQVEWRSNSGGTNLNIDTHGWVGRDRDRLWFRAEGDGDSRGVGEAQAHVLLGRQFARWWDVVAGVRQDFEPGPAGTWAAIGVQGLAPYWFEVELTGYIGASGRTHLRAEVEYEMLLTNSLILQPLVEIELYGKSDPERRIGSGLSTTDAGFRLRYEFKREFAPYMGVTWSNKWGSTADFAKTDGKKTGGARLVAGLRFWF